MTRVRDAHDTETTVSQALGQGVEHRDDCDMELFLGVGTGDGNKEMTCCYPRRVWKESQVIHTGFCGNQQRMTHCQLGHQDTLSIPRASQRLPEAPRGSQLQRSDLGPSPLSSGKSVHHSEPVSPEEWDKDFSLAIRSVWEAECRAWHTVGTSLPSQCPKATLPHCQFFFEDR